MTGFEEIPKKYHKAYKNWLALVDRISNTTLSISKESYEQKQKRIKKLLNSFPDFCAYYFPHYCSSPLGWFHLKAAKLIQDDPNIMAVLEWPREHAKSVFVNVLLPMWLKAKGELTGMIIASANEKKACILLGDIQAELMKNQRYIDDFGKQAALGTWTDGFFITEDGIGFWAFGRGQSPRGVRNADKRPNYGVIDDIDDKAIVKNQERVNEAVNWILGDFLGCMPIKASRLIIAGNRIHKKSILAHLVGDVEPGTPKRQDLTHIKVFAVEDERHKKSAIGAPGARPAWKERYSLLELNRRFRKMGSRNTAIEYFHEHQEEGFVFKAEHIHFGPCKKKLSQYRSLISYCDPSFKDTKKNDFKAIVLVGFTGIEYHILWAWLRQASVSAMVAAHYDLQSWVMQNDAKANCKYFMEANFIQDILLKEYEKEGESRGYQLPIKGDKRQKGDKVGRIENISPLFERALVIFNEAKKSSPDMQTLKDQFLGFPFTYDDGPDAVEGAISLSAKVSSNSAPRSGRFKNTSDRNAYRR